MDNDVESQIVLIDGEQKKICCKKYIDYTMIFLLFCLSIFIFIMFIMLCIQRFNH